jgi:hypothetical protein
MGRYLVSLNTGVVLPYSEAALKSPGVRMLSADEAAQYEDGLKTKKKFEPMDVTSQSAAPLLTPEPEPKPEPVVAEVVTQDISEGEPDIDAVLGALEAD